MAPLDLAIKNTSAETWRRSAADEHRRYREAIFVTQLSRAATAADILAGRLISAPQDAERVIALLRTVHHEVEKSVSDHESWTSLHHAVYLKSGTRRRVELGRSLSAELEKMIAHAERSGAADLHEIAHSISIKAEQLAGGSESAAE